MELTFTHTTTRGGNQASFLNSIPEDGMTITTKVPGQAQLIAQAVSHFDHDTPFTLAELTTAAVEQGLITSSKYGPEHIVRYYSKLLQTIGVMTKQSKSDDDVVEESDES